MPRHEHMRSANGGTHEASSARRSTGRSGSRRRSSRSRSRPGIPRPPRTSSGVTSHSAWYQSSSALTYNPPASATRGYACSASGSAVNSPGSIQCAVPRSIARSRSASAAAIWSSHVGSSSTGSVRLAAGPEHAATARTMTRVRPARRDDIAVRHLGARDFPPQRRPGDRRRKRALPGGARSASACTPARSVEPRRGWAHPAVGVPAVAVVLRGLSHPPRHRAPTPRRRLRDRDHRGVHVALGVRPGAPADRRGVRRVTADAAVTAARTRTGPAAR